MAAGIKAWANGGKADGDESVMYANIQHRNTQVFDYEAWNRTVHLGLLSDRASNEP